jgi:CheY-like chemotaxis protein
MPRVDGLEATGRVRRDSPAAKVLVLTSMSDDGADSLLDRDLATIHLGRYANNYITPTGARPLRLHMSGTRQTL